jgi:hypothetical protein
MTTLPDLIDWKPNFTPIPIARLDTDTTHLIGCDILSWLLSETVTTIDAVHTTRPRMFQQQI